MPPRVGSLLPRLWQQPSRLLGTFLTGLLRRLELGQTQLLAQASFSSVQRVTPHPSAAPTVNQLGGKPSSLYVEPASQTSREFGPRQRGNRMSLTSLVAKEVSVVVPVRDNQRGLDRLLRAFVDMPTGAKPAEVIVVDNLSSPPLILPERIDSVRLLRCARPGPAAARNVGWKASQSPWVLFTDSDCILTSSTLSGFADALDGSVGYAGRVRAIGGGLLAEYYEAQGTLLPMWLEDGRPAYFVTANALVWREALEMVEGFRESFDDAGGEDVDLSIRLRAVGSLGFARDAVVLHEFGDGFGQFVRRFARYGRGNRQVMSLHKSAGMAPKPVMPVRLVPAHAFCALTQFVAMSWGYHVGGAATASRSAAEPLGSSGRCI